MDLIDRAIASADAPVPPTSPIARGTFNLKFRSGRTAQLLIDDQADAADLLELVSVIGSRVPAKLAEWREQASGLVVVRALPLKV